MLRTGRSFLYLPARGRVSSIISRRTYAQEARIQMLDRRRFLGVCSALGVSSTLFPGVLWALAEQKEKVTKQMIDEAALVADVPIADEYKQMMLDGLNVRATLHSVPRGTF